MKKLLGAILVLAVFTYFLHPTHGPERRRQTRRWIVRKLRALVGASEAAARGTFSDDRQRGTTPGPERDPRLIDDKAEGQSDPAMQPERERSEHEELSAPSPETASRVWAEAGPAYDVEPQITIRESPLPPLREWQPEPEPAGGADDGGRARRGQRIARVAGGAVAAAVAALAVGLGVWALADEEGGRTTAPDEERLVEDQARAIAVLSQPDATRIPVEGSQGRIVLVVAPNGDAVLIVTGVRRAPARKTYEAWVIVGEDAHPAGLFAGGRRVVVPLDRPVPRGATVAVTLERAGGTASPTTKPLFAGTRG
jgi:hypothetical protein